jgi:cytochrome c-type biogenesis protein CcmH/NrfF
MKRFVSFMVLLALFFTVTVCLVFTQTALAQIPTPTPVAGIENITDDQVNAIARQMFCPVCENTPLDVCPTQACAEWRELIREKLAAGWSEAQIKQYFVDQFGDRVLAAPPARGINWLVSISCTGHCGPGASRSGPRKAQDYPLRSRMNISNAWKRNCASVDRKSTSDGINTSLEQIWRTQHRN